MGIVIADGGESREERRVEIARQEHHRLRGEREG